MSRLSPMAALVRRHDPDRFLTALFAPADRREALFLLYAFNHELARAREVTSQPMLALIRLQWWREVVEGETRRHEVAEPLGEALGTGRLNRDDLLAMIEGREAEAEGIARMSAWRDYVSRGAGGVAVAAGRALGGQGAVLERLRLLGAAYGIGGQVRSVAALARQGRCLLPEDLLAEHGLSAEAVIAAPTAPAVLAALHVLAEEGLAMLRAGAGLLPRDVVAAGLPAVLARRDLRRAGEPVGVRGFAARLAVVLAGMTRRV